jgi:hypothetical protein
MAVYSGYRYNHHRRLSPNYALTYIRALAKPNENSLVDPKSSLIQFISILSNAR